MLRWSLATSLDENRAGTLIANLLGVAAAAFFLVFAERRGNDAVRHFLLPGFCGGLTTFSTVMLLSLQSMNPPSLQIPMGIGAQYLFETVVLSALTIAICIPIARKVIPVKK